MIVKENSLFASSSDKKSIKTCFEWWDDDITLFYILIIYPYYILRTYALREDAI